MKLSRLGLGLFLRLFTVGIGLVLGMGAAAWGAEPPDFTGTWHVTAVFAEGSASSVLTLSESNGSYEGQSGPSTLGDISA